MLYKIRLPAKVNSLQLESFSLANMVSEKPINNENLWEGIKALFDI